MTTEEYECGWATCLQSVRAIVAGTPNSELRRAFQKLVMDPDYNGKPQWCISCESCIHQDDDYEGYGPYCARGNPGDIIVHLQRCRGYEKQEETIDE